MADRANIDECEGPVERRFVRLAKKRGWRTRKLNGAGNRGWPDRLVLTTCGVPLFIEFKRPGSKGPTKLQCSHLRWLRKHGYAAEWFDNAELAIAWCESHLKRDASC